MSLLFSSEISSRLEQEILGVGFWRHHIHSDPYKVCDNISSLKHDFHFPDLDRVEGFVANLNALFGYLDLATFMRKVWTRMTSCVFRSLARSALSLVSHSSEHRMLIASSRITMPWANSLLYFRCTRLTFGCRFVLWCSVCHSSSHVLFHQRPIISSLTTMSCHALAYFLIHRKNILIRNMQRKHMGDHMH